VASGVGQKPFVDLTWAPNTEPDLAGYNVYRRESNGAPNKVNDQPVKTPTYRDSAVVTPKTYSFAVSAVDARGNESPRSDEATETLP
jgi:fibronectin type 3 domain-containing protein